MLWFNSSGWLVGWSWLRIFQVASGRLRLGGCFRCFISPGSCMEHYVPGPVSQPVSSWIGESRRSIWRWLVNWQSVHLILLQTQIPFEEFSHSQAVKHSQVSPQNVLLATTASSCWVHQSSCISDHLQLLSKSFLFWLFNFCKAKFEAYTVKFWAECALQIAEFSWGPTSLPTPGLKVDLFSRTNRSHASCHNSYSSHQLVFARF